jgi:hypothetical protein
MCCSGKADLLLHDCAPGAAVADASQSFALALPIQTIKF